MAKNPEKLRALLEEVVDPSWENEAGQSFTVERSQVVSSMIRNQVARVVEALDPEGYAEYRTRKYRTGPNPTLAERRAAYRFLWGRFLECTYTVPGL